MPRFLSKSALRSTVDGVVKRLPFGLIKKGEIPGGIVMQPKTSGDLRALVNALRDWGVETDTVSIKGRHGVFAPYKRNLQPAKKRRAASKEQAAKARRAKTPEGKRRRKAAKKGWATRRKNPFAEFKTGELVRVGPGQGTIYRVLSQYTPGYVVIAKDGVGDFGRRVVATDLLRMADHRANPRKKKRRRNSSLDDTNLQWFWDDSTTAATALADPYVMTIVEMRPGSADGHWRWLVRRKDDPIDTVLAKGRVQGSTHASGSVLAASAAMRYVEKVSDMGLDGKGRSRALTRPPRRRSRAAQIGIGYSEGVGLLAIDIKSRGGMKIKAGTWLMLDSYGVKNRYSAFPVGRFDEGMRGELAKDDYYSVVMNRDLAQVFWWKRSSAQRHTHILRDADTGLTHGWVQGVEREERDTLSHYLAWDTSLKKKRFKDSATARTAVIRWATSGTRHNPG